VGKKSGVRYEMEAIMLVEQQIMQYIRVLPPSLQEEVLDFVRYLLVKLERQEQHEWEKFSLTSAMQGMEDEESPYTQDDLKVVFHE